MLELKEKVSNVLLLSLADSMSSIQTSICSMWYDLRAYLAFVTEAKQIEFLQSPIDRQTIRKRTTHTQHKTVCTNTYTREREHTPMHCMHALCSTHEIATIELRSHTHKHNNSTINLCVWPHCRWASRNEIKGIQKPFRALWKMSCWVLINRYSQTITLVVVRCLFVCSVFCLFPFACVCARKLLNILFV